MATWGGRSSPLARLRPDNLAGGCLHLAQAVAIVVSANRFSLPVRATCMTGPPGPTVGRQAVGCIAGIPPWVAIAIYLAGPGTDRHPPAFVYGISFSIFAFFNCFAINQWLQYRKVGKWKDYLFGERTYVTLSLVAKCSLPWQVFASAPASSPAR